MKTTKYYYVFEEDSKIRQFFIATLINLPVFAYGASIGWMSPMALLLQSKDTPTKEPLTNFNIAWMASIPYLSCIAADYFMAYMSDRFGRKLSLLFVSASLSISWILMLCTFNIYVMILARANIGLIMGGAFVTCPVYTREISDNSIRGALGCLVTLFQTSGNLFLYIIGDLLSYHTILWICLAMPVIHVALFITMPESPSFLVKTGKIEEARKVLAWLKCRDEQHPDIARELEHIKKEQENDSGNSKFVLKTILTDKILFRALCISSVVILGREMCGAITILNYAGEIFTIASEGSNLVLSPNQQAMVLGTVQVLGSLLASGIVEKAGRRALLFITCLISGVSMCALASWFLARDLGASGVTWLPILTLCVCIFCDSLGLQPISVLLVSEIFSYKYRGSMLAITMSTASILVFIQLLFFKSIAESIGVFVAFYIFGAVCLVGGLYVMLVIPETKNRHLEEIYADLRTKKEKARDKDMEMKAGNNCERL